jgi:hypothetical protein
VSAEGMAPATCASVSSAWARGAFESSMFSKRASYSSGDCPAQLREQERTTAPSGCGALGQLGRRLTYTE